MGKMLPELGKVDTDPGISKCQWIRQKGCFGILTVLIDQGN